MDIVIGDRIWNVDLDDRIGGGSFGSVYAASSNGDSAVVKLVPKAPGAQRELLLADNLSGVPNVVPVYGVADAGDSWAIVMPRAEQSLRDFLISTGSALDSKLALPILLDIATALVHLKWNGVVHRDLKPDNILLLNGQWCLTDFGISRYAEAATAPDTRKFMMTAPYAAPEQWRGIQATSATDVYAFGVIAFELLTGDWLFNGPDFRLQYIEETPPQLSASVDTPLRSIVDECLLKASQGHPLPERLLKRLEVQADDAAPGGGVPALMQAHHNAIQRQSEAARQESAAQSERERRADLWAAARQTFLRIEGLLGSLVRQNAPSANEGSWPIRVGNGLLHLDAPSACDRSEGLPFDVIAYTQVKVDQSNAPGGTYTGRSHSLWYCDAQQEGQYAWFETAFMRHPMMTHGGGFSAHRLEEPFASDPAGQPARHALSMGINPHQVAWPFKMLVDEQLNDFARRWAEWMGLAADGRLQHPHQMPEGNVHGSWRS